MHLANILLIFRLALVGGTSVVQLGSNIVGAPYYDSGTTVSLSEAGTRVAIGMVTPANDYAGRVRVYELQSNAWIQLGSNIVGEAPYDNSGTSVSLSAAGTRVAIGTPGFSSYAGRVRVYELQSNAWIQLGSNIDGEAANSHCGRSVSLSADGTRVAIGAPVKSSNTGNVRVYELQSNAWIQLGSNIDRGAANAQSGASVSLSADGTRVAIGLSPFIGAPGNSISAGLVRVYELQSNAWIQLGSNIDGEAVNDQSGASVSLSADGTRVAIGAPGNSNSAGRVRVYQLQSNAWIQLGSNIDGEAEYDDSGRSVSLSADGAVVAISSPYANSYDGHVRVYYVQASGSTAIPTAVPTVAPTAVPTVTPTAIPTAIPTVAPTAIPTAVPTVAPTAIPTAVPTVALTAVPTVIPTAIPTAIPTVAPTAIPTAVPTVAPTAIPTAVPTVAPTAIPTSDPTVYATHDNGESGRIAMTKSSGFIAGISVGAFVAVCCLVMCGMCYRRRGSNNEKVHSEARHGDNIII